MIPLTTRQRPGWQHHVPLTVAGRISYAVTEQIRTVAGARLAGTGPIATLTAATIAEIQPVLSAMIGAS